MGGALLSKLLSEGRIDLSKSSCVFLAPAIDEIAPNIGEIPKALGSTWLLGEADTTVNNRSNISHCFNSGGNLMFSPGDDHSLSKALQGNLIDSAVLTAFEFRENFIKLNP